MLLQIVKKHPLWSFMVINCVISWAFLYPCYQLILNSDEIPPLAFIGLIGAYGPSIAAIIVTRVEHKEGLKSCLKKQFHWKFSAAPVIGVMVLALGAYLMADLLAIYHGGQNIQVDLVQGFKGIPIWLLLALPFGPMGEELGWRGFLLPRLLKRHSILKSTLIVGVAWGIWHLASFSFPGAAIPSFLPVTWWSIGLFVLNTCCLSFLYTAAFFKSKGSVLVAIALHTFLNAASNISEDFFGQAGDTSVLLTGYIVNMIIILVVGLLLLKRWSNTNLQ